MTTCTYWNHGPWWWWWWFIILYLLYFYWGKITVEWHRLIVIINYFQSFLSGGNFDQTLFHFVGKWQTFNTVWTLYEHWKGDESCCKQGESLSSNVYTLWSADSDCPCLLFAEGRSLVTCVFFVILFFPHFLLKILVISYLFQSQEV